MKPTTKTPHRAAGISRTTPWPQLPELMSVPQAARRIGMGAPLYRQLAKKGEVPLTIYSSARHIVKRSDLQKWVNGEWAPTVISLRDVDELMAADRAAEGRG
jgi:hypothetical protein